MKKRKILCSLVRSLSLSLSLSFILPRFFCAKQTRERRYANINGVSLFLQAHSNTHISSHARILALSPIILYLSTNPFLPLSPHFPKTFSFLSQLRSTPFFEPLSFRVVVVGFTPPPSSFRTQEWAPFWAPLSPSPLTRHLRTCVRNFSSKQHSQLIFLSH